VTTAVRWLHRRSSVRAAARRAAAGRLDKAPEVALPVRVLRTGALVGPQGSEIGVVWGPGGWTSALWVADGADDALARLLALSAPVSPAVRMRSVLQQTSPGPTGPAGGPVEAVPLSAWLALHVDPVRAVRAREAVGAVPALLRSEIRSLLDHTRPGAVGLVALDHSDLVDALAASAELPRGAGGASDAAESWGSWRAAGRAHRSFAVRPGPVPLATVVELLLDGVTLHPGTTVTVAVRHVGPGARATHPVTARVSHRDAAVAREVWEKLRRVLGANGVRCRPLGGRQGPALLDTTLLAATH
jgi:hypothetical protein